MSLNTFDNFSEIVNEDFIDFIKIDTKGHESKVIDGGKQIIKNKKVKIIQVEYNIHHLVTKTTISEISKKLGDFDVFILNILDGSLKKIDPLDSFSNLCIFSYFIFIEKNFYEKNKKIFLTLPCLLLKK